MEEKRVKTNDIELRSEKVRNIIGQIPPFLVRGGIGIIAMVVVLALAVCYSIPYYETVQVRVELFSDPASEICLSPAEGHVQLLSRYEAEDTSVNRGDTIGCIESADSLIRLVANISGRLSVNVRQNESVMAGDVLYSITPDSISGIYGRLLLPYEYRTKLKTGQSVKIELDGFPSKEYGVWEGSVGRIYPLAVGADNNFNVSDVETASFLKMDVDLPMPLISSNGSEIVYAPKMCGSASIVISKRSLLLKLFTK
jgi:hypothetical protein